MELSRRELLAAGAVGGAALVAGLATGANASAEDTGLIGLPKTAKPKRAVLKIASQEGRIPGKDLPEKLAKMESWDINGLEVGGRGLEKRIGEINGWVAGTVKTASATFPSSRSPSATKAMTGACRALTSIRLLTVFS